MEFLRQADSKTIATALVLLGLSVIFFGVVKLITFLELKYSKKESTKMLENALKNMANGQNTTNDVMLTNMVFISEQIKEMKDLISNILRNNLLVLVLLLLSVSFVSHLSSRHFFAEGEKPVPVKTCNPPCTGNTYCDTSTGTCVARTSVPLSGFDFVDLNKTGNENYTSYLGFNR